jgi:ABC-2 type transport system permease protein
MRTHVLLSIFRRNFTSYFSSPIGYVFICAFVLLSAVAAFWPNEFFNANLANLDQLNEKLPWIMLVFIPAITMSIWADERRQGTDELLLTMPAADFEVVLGKYLAALAIFAVALLFSLSNIFVLAGLGDPDLGLLLANYLGYLFVGAAMLSLGVAASFITSNLTVAFILAAAFNAPFVFAAGADAIVPWETTARAIEGFGFVARFDDFGRGVISLSNVVYFVAIAVVMLYVCMVLIGRRHWVVRSASGPMAASMAVHYGVRVIALLAIVGGLTVLAGRFDLRIDATSERLSSVSGETRALIENLTDDRPVFVDAYISPDVPEGFVQTRLNLLSMLREVGRRGGDSVIVRVNDTERFSAQASEAEEQFGIVARQVPASTGGKIAIEEIHLGVSFTSGLDKVVVPFFDRGIPVEYEMVRSIATVSQQTRRRIGVISTDATLFGGFDMQSFSSRPDQPIITELRKQYEVESVNATSPIPDGYDALLAVQPSSLPQPQLDNLLAAIRRGVPTAIFEDPFPFLDGAAPPTSQPRRPANQNPFMQQRQPPPEPKGDITALWSMLGVRFTDSAVVWDDYNPYPKVESFYPEFVFIGPGSGEPNALEPSSVVTGGLQQVLLIFAGTLNPIGGGAQTFTPLLRTGRETGLVPFDELTRRGIFGQTSLNPARRHVPTRQSYVVGARITGPAPAAAAPDPDAPTPALDDAGALDVTLVADLDVLQGAFFMVRAAGRDDEAPVTFDFDNVTLVLNMLDDLAGDDRFIPIRSRRPRHRTLTAVEARTEAARAAANDQRQEFLDAFETQRTEEEQKLNDELARLRERGGMDAREMELEIAMKTQVGQNRLDARIESLERERDQRLERIERDLALEIRAVQDRYKIAAVGLPPIPPLLVAGVVFMRRRAQERVGVPTSRLRSASGGTPRATVASTAGGTDQ